MAKINNSGFIESNSIIVYPCAYRESSIDLKSKLNLEESIVRTALYGSTGNRTYVVSKTDTKLVCFIKGYYFEITVENNEFDNYAGIVINTGQIMDNYAATVLTPFDGNPTDTVDQQATGSSVYYFKALKFVKVNSTHTPDLYFDESKNTKPVSYANVGSVKLASTITGNLISGTGKGSVVQIKNNEVTNIASAENAIAIGEGTTAKHSNELAIGKYNAETEDGNLFVIGVGDKTTKKNILTIGTTSTTNYAYFTGATVKLDSTSSLFNECTTEFDGEAIFNNTLTADGEANFYNTLDAYGEANFYNTLDAYGEANFYNTLTCTNQIKGTSFYATSDERLKENIVDYIPENSILNLPIKEFDFKSDGSHHIGCIAQDLQKICPELVQEDKDGYLSIEESKLIYLLLDEVKKLKKRVDELECK